LVVFSTSFAANMGSEHGAWLYLRRFLVVLLTLSFIGVSCRSFSQVRFMATCFMPITEFFHTSASAKEDDNFGLRRRGRR